MSRANPPQPPREQATGPERRPVWLDDALLSGQGPSAASTWAWDNRWTAIPVAFEAIVSLADAYSLTTSELRHLTLIAARRIHFAFAFETLSRFCRSALLRFPDDELLTVLRCAADVILGTSSWKDLEANVAGHPAEGISNHVLLTAVYLSEGAPQDVLERTLTLAERLSGDGDLIALYRMVSILRRLGRYEESLAAGMKVNGEIVSGEHPPGLCDHLSERVLVERHIVVELMGLRTRERRHRVEDPLRRMGL